MQLMDGQAFNDVFVSPFCQVVEELRKLIEFYAKETGKPNNFLALALSSRKNLCVHPEVCIHNWSVCFGKKIQHDCNICLCTGSGQFTALWEGGGWEVSQSDCIVYASPAPE